MLALFLSSGWRFALLAWLVGSLEITAAIDRALNGTLLQGSCDFATRARS